MGVINTNIKALQATNAMTANNRVMSTTMQQLSTGKRINTAGDDAAGLAVVSKMTSQIRGLDQAVRNANDAVSMLQTAEGAVVEVSNMLQRMRELAVQAATDTNTADDRSYLNLEYQQLMGEITRIAGMTQWNGMKILNNTEVGTSGLAANPSASGNEVRNVKFQVGANADQTISIAMKDFSFGTGTPAVASERLFNLGQLASGGNDTLSGATSFSITFGSAGVATGTNASTTITFTTTAISNSTATGANDMNNIAAALQAAITQRAGFENVSVVKTGNTVTIEDSLGRTIGGLSFGATPTALNIDTEIAAGSIASGATAPSATAVFGGNAQINDTSITDATTANLAIGRLDNALKNVNNERATMGAVINRLNYAADNLANVSMNTSAARSRVLDTDYAKTTTELARTQIISQAATAMLAQANQQPAAVLSLLQ